MSAIAGVLRLDGAPADAGLIGRMLDSMSHRGPDGRGMWTSGAVALGHLARHTTPESTTEHQPLAAEDGTLVLVFDGRVDNRDELVRRLDADGVPVRHGTDAEIVLRAWQRWGAECPDRILGDFAFALWDAPHRLLFCARDIVGIRPFCYRVTARGVQFASEPQALLQDADFSPRPNEGMVAEHLAGIVTSRRETVIDGLLRLPPAHTLVAGAGGVAERCYWTPDPGRTIRYRHDREYEEHLRAVFRDAVRDRLRARTRVGVMLSGGLDSSSIAGMAARLHRDEPGAPAIETVSLTFPGRPCDEAPFADAVNRMWGLRGHAVPEPRVPWVQVAEREARQYADVPGTPSLTNPEVFAALPQAAGLSVFLFGAGGDEWLRGTPARYADLLAAGRLRALGGELARDARTDDFVGWPAALRQAVWPLLPGPLRRTIKTLVRHDVVPAWVDPDLVARTALRDRLAQFRAGLRFASRAQIDGYQEAISGEATLAMERLDRALAFLGVEGRHPFHDRRLIEIALAFPPDQLWRDGQAKSLTRRAFADLLPPAVRQRTGRPDYSHLIAEALAAHGRAGDRAWPMATARGWVVKDRLAAEYARVTRRLGTTSGRAWQSVWPVWGACAVECWASTL
ncbi:MAG TPA: asparagine synthase-related protein [Vicinamibacterales bacterium]|nr:asparagine synthase-related protein [Vicinamibacterales bacterium]